MNHFRNLLIIAATCIMLASCSKKDKIELEEETLLETSFTGMLTLFHSNTYPAFAESVQIPADVDKNGTIVFGIGSLEYYAEDDNGDSKIRRDGELVLIPEGYYFIDKDEIHFAVNENTSVTENMIVWYWDNSQWVEAINENVTELWDGGLDFRLNEATVSGSVVEESNPSGTVSWTLILSPKL